MEIYIKIDLQSLIEWLENALTKLYPAVEWLGANL